MTTTSSPATAFLLNHTFLVTPILAAYVDAMAQDIVHAFFFFLQQIFYWQVVSRFGEKGGEGGGEKEEREKKKTCTCLCMCGFIQLEILLQLCPSHRRPFVERGLTDWCFSFSICRGSALCSPFFCFFLFFFLPCLAQSPSFDSEFSPAGRWKVMAYIHSACRQHGGVNLKWGVLWSSRAQ